MCSKIITSNHWQEHSDHQILLKDPFCRNIQLSYETCAIGTYDFIPGKVSSQVLRGNIFIKNNGKSMNNVSIFQGCKN